MTTEYFEKKVLEEVERAWSSGGRTALQDHLNAVRQLIDQALREHAESGEPLFSQTDAQSEPRVLRQEADRRVGGHRDPGRDHHGVSDEINPIDQRLRMPDVGACKD